MTMYANRHSLRSNPETQNINNLHKLVIGGLLK
jgi:hypothetical protein